MKKKEFKKILYKEYPEALVFAKLSVWTGIFFLANVLFAVTLQILGIINLTISIILSSIIIILAIPMIIVDVKNDQEINASFKNYKQNKKVLKYNDKTSFLKRFRIINIILLVVLIFCLIIGLTHKAKMTFKMEDGTKVVTKYVKFNDYQIKIPENFNKLTEEYIAKIYGGENAPSRVYSDESISVNIAITENKTEYANEDMEEYLNLMRSTLLLYGEDLETEVKEIEGIKVGHLKVTTEYEDKRIYNHLIYFILEDTLTTINFNCIESLKTKWAGVADFLFESLRFV